MRKTLVFVLSSLVIVQAIAIGTLLNKKPNIVTKNVLTSSSPQIVYKDRIIYKDKIVYKDDAVDQKIQFQSRIFLTSTIENGNGGLNPNYGGINGNLSDMFGFLNSKDGLLFDLIAYNKSHPKGDYK